MEYFDNYLIVYIYPEYFLLYVWNVECDYAFLVLWWITLPSFSATQMCENRYLHLPVVDEETGEVMGVVDVMEIIEATVGQEGSAG